MIKGRREKYAIFVIRLIKWSNSSVKCGGCWKNSGYSTAQVDLDTLGSSIKVSLIG